MAADFDDVSPVEFFRDYPDDVEMPPLNFVIGGPSLFDQQQSGNH